MTTTNCPNCGRDMPMVTWTGEKPECHRCNGATYVEDGSDLYPMTVDSEEHDCLHEALDESLPPSQRGVHNLVCNCPKCRAVY